MFQQEMVPALKYIRGDMFSEKHWVEMFSILGAPYKPIENLMFGDFLKIRDVIRNKIDALQVMMKIFIYCLKVEVKTNYCSALSQK